MTYDTDTRTWHECLVCGHTDMMPARHRYTIQATLEQPRMECWEVECTNKKCRAKDTVDGLCDEPEPPEPDLMAPDATERSEVMQRVLREAGR